MELPYPSQQRVPRYNYFPMKTSQELLRKANIIPRLKLGQRVDGVVVSTGDHRVKIIKDKTDTGTDYYGKPIEIVRYLVEENGQPKFYEVPLLGKDGQLHYLVQKLADIPEGSEIVLRMEKRGMKNVVTVEEICRTHTVEYDEGEELNNENL